MVFARLFQSLGLTSFLHKALMHLLKVLGKFLKEMWLYGVSV